jgi:hypothetical protein
MSNDQTQEPQYGEATAQDEEGQFTVHPYCYVVQTMEEPDQFYQSTAEVQEFLRAHQEAHPETGAEVQPLYTLWDLEMDEGQAIQAFARFLEIHPEDGLKMLRGAMLTLLSRIGNENFSIVGQDSDNLTVHDFVCCCTGRAANKVKKAYDKAVEKSNTQEATPKLWTPESPG